MPANPSLEYSLPQLRAAEARLRALAQQLGISYALAQYGGMRTQADTNQILNYRLADYRVAVKKDPRVARIPIDQWRPIAPFGRSLHNWGAAFDIVITGVPRGWTAGKALAALGAVAPQAGLRWGGTFSRDRNDPPHFELPIAVVDARAAYLKYTNGKGYQGPKSPLDFFRQWFTPSSSTSPAPAPVEYDVGPVLPDVQYMKPRTDDNLLNIRVEAAPLPQQAPVNATTTEDEPAVIGRISSNARASSAPRYVLAGDDIGDVPVRTDATDAVLLAQAQEAKRQRDMKVLAGLVVVGLIVASSRQGRRR